MRGGGASIFLLHKVYLGLRAKASAWLGSWLGRYKGGLVSRGNALPVKCEVGLFGVQCAERIWLVPKAEPKKAKAKPKQLAN
jgi:hypothetical protein